MLNILTSFFSTLRKSFFTIFLSVIVVLTFTYFFIDNYNRSLYFSNPYITKLDKTSGKEFLELRFCPNLSSQDFNASKGISNSRIAILTAILNYENYEDYVGIGTLQCYSNYFGYQLHLVNMTDQRYSNVCNQTDHFFRRHCVLATFLEDKNDTIDYALIIDADVGIINPCHAIQEYIDSEKSVEIIFYERYYDHEIAAGSYLLKNTEYSRKFMHFWADYFYRLPNSVHGSDNGAIHQVFMELHFDDEKQKMQCYTWWNNSKNNVDLFVFDACTKNALFLNSTLFVNNTIKIIRKMTPGWVRDGWLTGTKWAPQDFIFHGWKKSRLNEQWRWPFAYNFNAKECSYLGQSFKHSNFKYLSEFVSTNTEVIQLLAQKVKEVEADYQKILKDNKIGMT